ncbi:hypothetical protein COI11_10410 [Neisseria meningitidis]|nr:hypothetical protein JY81_05215 [Neisseria meningitidis]RQJ69620.1 hypothetical protein COI11_10410 [Neisseria meningitidis]
MKQSDLCGKILFQPGRECRKRGVTVLVLILGLFEVLTKALSGEVYRQGGGCLSLLCFRRHQCR